MLGFLKSWTSSILSLLRKNGRDVQLINNQELPISDKDDGQLIIADFDYGIFTKINEYYNMTQSLSICMVIKNEAKVITKTLDAAMQCADEIVIMDTGSTDGTVDIIKRWKTARKMNDRIELSEVGNRFHDESGNFHFGHAKNAVMREASCDYVMWLDGSDVITNPVKFRQDFIKACSKSEEFVIRMPTTLADLSWYRYRVFPYGRGKFVGAVHEYLELDSEILENTYISNVKIAHQIKENRKNSVHRNLKILNREWKTDKTPRNAFYIANSYYDIGEYENALKFFEIRIRDFEIDEFPQEVFKSYENACSSIIKIHNKKYLPYLDDYSSEMVDMYDTRKEGHYYRAEYLFAKGDMRGAYNEYLKVRQLDTPHDGVMWSNPEIYNNSHIESKMVRCKNR